MTHLKGLNDSVRELKFYDRATSETSKKVMSFCYLSGLINNENVRFVQRSTERNALLGYIIKNDDDESAAIAATVDVATPAETITTIGA